MAPKTQKTSIETLYRKGVGFVYRGSLETDLTLQRMIEELVGIKVKCPKTAHTIYTSYLYLRSILSECSILILRVFYYNTSTAVFLLQLHFSTVCSAEPGIQ